MTNAPDGKRDYFVSYTGRDEPWAEWLAWTVEEAGWSVWFQKWDFRGNFVLRMDHATDLSDRTIGILSAEALASKQVQAEWDARRAVDPRNEQESLILIKIGLCEMPGLLKPFVWLDLAETDPSTAKAELLTWLKRQRRKPGTAPPFPPGPDREKPIRRPSFPGPIHNLPPRNPDFVGREQELARLLDLLVADEPVVLTQAITGLGGVGKTQTALAYAHRHLADCRLVWWLKAEQPVTLAADYAAMAEPLGLPVTADQPKRVEAVRRALEGLEGWLLVFDNVEDPAAVQRDYFPRRGDGRVLLTSRRTDWRGVAKALPLDVMPQADAVALLLGGAEVRTREQQAEAAALAQELGHLPLALTQAHGYIVGTGRSLADYRALLATRREDLLRRGVPNDYELPVLLTWGPSLKGAERECPAARPLLELLAFFSADPLPRAMLATAPEALPELLHDPLVLDDAVAALVRFSLITATQATLTVHRLVQAIVRADLATALVTARARCAVRLASVGWPSDLSNQEGWSAARAMLPHALAATQAAMKYAPTVATTSYVLDKAATYLQIRGAYAEAASLFEQALALGEKTLGPEHPDIATSLNNLAACYWETGRYAEAEPLYQRALAIREKSLGPEHPDLIASLNNLAELYRSTSRLAEAELLFRHVLAIGEKSQSLNPEYPYLATWLNNLANLYWSTGRYAEAEPLYVRALTISERTLGFEHPTLATRLSNLATLYWSTGRYGEAEPLIRRGLGIDEKAFGPKHPNFARSLNVLANVYRDAGRHAEAEPLYARAIAIMKESLPLGHPRQALFREDYALLLDALDRHEEASALRAQAAAIRPRCEQGNQLPPSPPPP